MNLPSWMKRRTCCGSSFITPVFPRRMRLFLIAVSFLFSFDWERDDISSFSLGISTRNKFVKMSKLGPIYMTTVPLKIGNVARCPLKQVHVYMTTFWKRSSGWRNWKNDCKHTVVCIPGQFGCVYLYKVRTTTTIVRYHYILATKQHRSALEKAKQRW